MATLALVAVTAARGQAAAWPALHTPPGARMQTVAGDMVFNGKPCRVLRFEAKATDSELLAFYREQFGPRHVENRVRGDRVIATRQGDYFHTVQLHSIDPQHTQGTLMTTLLRDTGSTAVSAEMVKVLPAETAVLSTIQSSDGGQRSVMVVGINLDSARANRDHVLAALQARGFHMRKDDAANARAFALVLSSGSEEVAVTITDAGPYRSVLLNRTKELK